MAEPDDDDVFQVNTDDVRMYASFLDGRSGELGTTIGDVGGIKLVAGDPDVIPGAGTLTGMVDTRKTDLTGNLGNLRTDLETLSKKTVDVATMYDKNEDKNKDIATSVTLTDQD